MRAADHQPGGTFEPDGLVPPLATVDDEDGAAVSFADKVRNKTQEFRGRIKRNTGEVIGDRGMQAEGSADEVKSNLKQIGEKVKDAFRGRGTRRRGQH